MQRGKPIVISAPSGSGNPDTIASGLLKKRAGRLGFKDVGKRATR